MKKLLLIALVGVLLITKGCKKEEKGAGSAVFYAPTNSHGKITITITGSKINSTTFTVPVTNNPDSYCTSGYTGYIHLDVGTYKYSASAADGTKWNGSIEIKKDNCLKESLQ